MTFNQFAFNQFMIEHQVIKQFDTPITLKSGKQSCLYINWRTVSNDAYLLDQLVDYVLKFTKDHNIHPDTFFGVPEGASKLGVLTQYKYAKENPNYNKGSHILSMGRAKPKPHGDPSDQYFIGEPKGNICVIEDVTTTGQSLIACVKQLQSMGHTIQTAIGLTNRNDLGDNQTKTHLKKLGVNYFAMSHSNDILH